MIWAGLTVLFAMQASGGDTVPDTPVTVSMVAVQATHEGRAKKFVAPELKKVRNAVIGLDYDTFNRVREQRKPVPYGQESEFAINARYTLYVTPLSRAPDGRIRIKARIVMHPRTAGRESIDALNTTLIMVPGKHLNLGGMKLDVGELIVVMSLSESA